MEYTLRRLKADDIFPMIQLLSKLGVKELKDSLDPEVVKKSIQMIREEGNDEDNKENLQTELIYSVGMSVVLDVVEFILVKLPTCKKEIYTILANVSGLSVKDIADLDFAVFTNMIFDFVQKEELGDFIKAVSRFFK
ncbi:hypothetical protein P261_02278 [Lachnospiraceae bacterium TWA4]|nr:hypothetical protein P261_02278 [Lachnospiraceae bacterium TWA4]